MLPKFLKHGKKSRSQLHLPFNLGSQPPSSTTVGSGVSLGSQVSQLPPENVALRRVPENAEQIRTPAELEASREKPPVSVPIRQPQPRYYQHIEQQQRTDVTDEEMMSQARQENDIIAKRNEEKRAEKRILERKRNASADNVRRLRELIRERYALDVYLWKKRGVPRASRKRIEPKCKKADAILQEIYWIVNEWDEELFDKHEWQVAKRIKEGLPKRLLDNGDSGEPAIWGDLAPWDRREDND